MALAVNIDKKPMLPVVANAINQIFHDPVDPFFTGRVMDLLFDGVDIDCSSSHFEAQATCSVLGSGDVQAIRIINEELLRFSMLGGVSYHLVISTFMNIFWHKALYICIYFIRIKANATALGTWKVFRGVKNFRDVGKMLAFNDDEELDVWGTDECNQYRGTDSTIFPPMLRKEDGLWAYEPSLCLSIGAFYVGPSNYAGIPTWEYTMKFGDPKVSISIKYYLITYKEI